MHTLEIGGRPIAIVNSDRDDAEAWFASDVFKEDLMVLEDSDGKNLWSDEDEAAFFVRRSFPEEESLLEKSFARALREGDADQEDEDGWLTFLIKVRDPTDDAFDEDGNLKS